MPLPNELSLSERDRRYLLHPTTHLPQHRNVGPIVVTEGKGVFVRDTEGKEYIEAMAGLWCTALGYGVEELAETAAEQMRKLAYGHLFGGRSHEAAIALAERLVDIAPFPASRVFFGTSGSDANDTQVKLVWYYNNARGRPEKKNIIARKGGYHGVTVASGSMTALPAMHTAFDLPIDRFHHVSCPHFAKFAAGGETEEDFATRLAEELDQKIRELGPETVGAFIAEPVLGAGGVVPPPRTYFDKVQEVLQAHDVLFIDDEVITGFGRTGKPFGADTYQLNPDTMSLAKGLSSAYIPISAVLLTEDIYEVIEAAGNKLGVFGHGFTYTGHPVSCAVALKNIELMEERRVMAHVADVAPLFQQRLQSLGDHPLVLEVRGVGLIGALELKASAKVGAVGAHCVKACLSEGLIVRALGDSVALCPPLIITSDEIDAVFDRLETALDETAVWAKAEGLFN